MMCREPLGNGGVSRLTEVCWRVPILMKSFGDSFETRAQEDFDEVLPVQDGEPARGEHNPRAAFPH